MITYTAHVSHLLRKRVLLKIIINHNLIYQPPNFSLITNIDDVGHMDNLHFCKKLGSLQ